MIRALLKHPGKAPHWVNLEGTDESIRQILQAQWDVRLGGKRNVRLFWDGEGHQSYKMVNLAMPGLGIIRGSLLMCACGPAGWASLEGTDLEEAQALLAAGREVLDPLVG